MTKLTIKRGTTYGFTVNYERNGDPDITGATIYFTMKSVEYDSDDDDSDAVISKTITIHTNPTEGTSSFELTPEDTYIDPTSYYFDIRIKDADDKVYPIDEGRIKIDGSPTNRASV